MPAIKLPGTKPLGIKPPGNKMPWIKPLIMPPGIMLLAVLLLARPAWAESTQLRFAQQFGTGYLPLNVMRHHDFLANRMAAAGLKPITVTWLTFNGPDRMNEAVRSGAVDIASGGIPALISVWAETHHSMQEVRGIAALAQEPLLLNTRNPNIHTISDFTDASRIAVPAIRDSVQAVLLQMAAAKQWGVDAYDRLDKLTVLRAPADATNQLIAGSSDFDSAFSVPPYQTVQLAQPGVHTVLQSSDLVGSSSITATWTTKRFRDANPKLYKAIIDAMQDACDFIAAHPAEAAADYDSDTSAKLDPALVQQAVTDPRTKYSLTPRSTMQWVTFMQSIKRIKVAPKTWKELFWPDIYKLDGD
jgi:NitT/TauT family transport system substrate-binding protein